MPDQNSHSSSRRTGLRPLVFSLLLLLLAAATVIALSPDEARAELCMAAAESSEDAPDCGGVGEPPPPGDGGGGGGGSCSGVVVLYEHASFQGRCWAFGAGETGWVGGEANDQASSIWVADGYAVTIFLHAWFDGAAHNTVTAADPWSWEGIGNDNVSSLVVQQSAPDSTYYWGGSETEETDERALTWYAESGCSKVGSSVAHRNTYRRLWRFALVTRFCWNGSAITAIWEREVAVNIDPLPFPFSLIQGWRYTPIAFHPGETGHSSTVVRADGRFDFCGFRYGCLTTQQPWVRIELHAGGEAVCTTSARARPFACERVNS